jgi:hypothetical protein
MGLALRLSARQDSCMSVRRAFLQPTRPIAMAMLMSVALLTDRVRNRVGSAKPIAPMRDVPSARAVHPDEHSCLVRRRTRHIFHVEFHEASLQNADTVHSIGYPLAAD